MILKISYVWKMTKNENSARIPNRNENETNVQLINCWLIKSGGKKWSFLWAAQILIVVDCQRQKDGNGLTLNICLCSKSIWKFLGRHPHFVTDLTTYNF